MNADQCRAFVCAIVKVVVAYLLWPREENFPETLVYDLALITLSWMLIEAFDDLWYGFLAGDSEEPTP